LGELHHRPGMRVSPAVMVALEHYSYPGNVRELRNLLERAMVHARSAEVAPGDLPEPVQEATKQQRKMLSLAELERAYIAEVLDHTRGKKSRAAEILGISRKTLLEKRKRYDLG